MIRAVVATVVWLMATLLLVGAIAVWLSDHATWGQAVVGSMIVTLMTVPFTTLPMFRVWTQELNHRRNR